MSKPMMKCGHAANATSEDGTPVCVVCIGLNPDAVMVVEEAPSLEGRVARCSYARASETHSGGGQYARQQFNSARPSSTNLAFFRHKPDQSEDEFYCGCWGWD